MASQQKPKQKQKNNLSFEKELSIWVHPIQKIFC